MSIAEIRKHDEISSEFTFVWKIKNINDCMYKKGDKLKSPTFTVRDKGEWGLVFYPNGDQTMSFECALRLKSESESNTIALTCQFCVCNSEQKLYYCEGKELNYTSRGESQTVARFGREIFDELQDDTFVLHCHMWNNLSDKIENPVHYIVETRFIQRTNIFHWKLENFSTFQLGEEKKINSSLEFPRFTYSTVSMTVKLFLSGKSLNDALIQLRLYFEGLDESKVIKVTCALNVMDENKRIKKYIRGEYWLSMVVNVVKISFKRVEVMSGGLPNDTLILQGKVVFSTHSNFDCGGDYYDPPFFFHTEMGRVYGLQTNEAVNAAETLFKPPVSETLPSLPPSSALPSDMLSLYEGSGPPSDFQLCVAGRSFPVHQLVLEARSTVFQAMFASNMQETTRRSLELTDIDAATAERMLLYMYTDEGPPKDLSYELLVDLYAAADKYALSGLRQVCGKRLAQDMDLDNAPRILQISDRHSDPLLKQKVLDFFVSQGLGAIETENWKKLEGDDPKLANEVLHKIIYQNQCNTVTNVVTNPKKRGKRAKLGK